MFDDSSCSSEASPVLDNGGNPIIANSGSTTITVNKHQLVITPEIRPALPQTSSIFAIAADITDFTAPTIVVPSGITVTLTGNGVTAAVGITDPSTSGVIIVDNHVDGITAGSIRIHAGTNIFLTSFAEVFKLTFDSSDEGLVTFTFVDGNGKLNGPETTIPVGSGQLPGIGIEDGNEIVSVHIIAISADPTNPTADPADRTVGFSRLQTFNSDNEPIVDSTAEEIGDPGGANSIILNGGGIYAQGESPPPPSSNGGAVGFYQVDYKIFENVDYLESLASILYDTVPSELDLGGIGSSAAVRDDSGRGRTTVDCVVDTDADGFCEEGGLELGLPYSVDRSLSGGTTVEYRLPIPGSFVTGTQDAWVEVDYLPLHAPFGGSLPPLSPDNGIFGGIETVFAANSKNIVFDIDDQLPTHHDFLFVWTKGLEGDRTDNFECLKADFFGKAGQRPGVTDATTFSITNPNLAQVFKTLSIWGVRANFPPNALTGDDTSGVITVQRVINVADAVTSLTISATPTLTTGNHPVAPLYFGTITHTVEQIDTGKFEITLQIPYEVTARWGGFNFAIGGIQVPMLFSTATTAFPGNTPCPTKITSTLIDAKALSSRYLLIGHGMGGSTGQAEFNGNDMVMTVADLGSVVDMHEKGTTEEQQGTVMHELGHSLGLEHGGLDNINCKVNNAGVMPYSRQIPLYLSVAQWKLDFSHGTLGTIDENSLPEVMGRPRTTDASILPLTIVYGNPNSFAVAGIGGPMSTLNLNWNGNFEIADTTPMGGQDPNNMNIIGCGASPGEPPYIDHDEWGGLDFIFTDTPSGFFDGSWASGRAELTAFLAEMIEIQTAVFQVIPPFEADGTYVTKKKTNVPVKFAGLDDEGNNLLNISAELQVFKSDGTLIDTIPFLLEISGNHYHASWSAAAQAGDYWLSIKVAHVDSPELESLIFDPDNLHCISGITPENECVITMDGDETLLPEGLVSLKVTLTQKGGGK